MFLRRRRPGTDHPHEPEKPCPICDIDMSSGPVGNVRGYTARTIGAVTLPLAVPHVPKAAKPWVVKRNQEQALDPEEREARIRARKAAWQRARRAKARA